jgi:hypothetical protein
LRLVCASSGATVQEQRARPRAATAVTAAPAIGQLESQLERKMLQLVNSKCKRLAAGPLHLLATGFSLVR